MFILGSIYNTDASDAFTENRVKHPNWPEANQLVIYKRDYRAQI